MEVRLPFLDRFRGPLASGRKTMTARTRKHGDAGDWFRAFGQVYQLRSVEQERLGSVASQWDAEGCSSADDFRAVWSELHPVTGYVASQLVWVHRFKKVDGQTQHLPVPPRYGGLSDRLLVP